MTEKAVAVQFGVKLGDVRFSMTTYGVARDIDIEAKHDVFRFATIGPWEDVEISVPWNSPLSRQLESVSELIAKRSLGV